MLLSRPARFEIYHLRHETSIFISLGSPIIPMDGQPGPPRGFRDARRGRDRTRGSSCPGRSILLRSTKAEERNLLTEEVARVEAATVKSAEAKWADFVAATGAASRSSAVAHGYLPN